MVELGSGGYVYETTGEDWGKLQPDATYKEATAVALIDALKRFPGQLYRGYLF